MNGILDTFSNRALWCSLTAWFVSQLIKYLINGFRTHTWAFIIF